jgi:exodeoxyribonuclease VII large subunit
MEKIFSVSEFIAEVNALLAFPVVIEGEVSSFRVNQGKWVFFDLKDEKAEALVNCFGVVWKLNAPVEDGMRVRIYGTPKIFEKSGKFSITVERIEPVGEGALKRAFELMKKKLEAEGLFSPARKRALPEFPKSIALVASRESAAAGDFLRIMGDRWGGVTVHLYHVQVQGEAAKDQLVEAIRYFSSPEAPEVEALAVIRGGGSIEDLQAFNSEEVARAIYASRVVTVVGVGHERDETIADFVSDVRASTPSNAAERLFPKRTEVSAHLDHLVARAEGRFGAILAASRERISASLQSVFNALSRQSGRYRGLVGVLKSQLGRFAERLVHYKGSVDLLGRSIANLNPERLLSRGYAVVRREGAIVRDASSLAIGEGIEVRLGKGSIGADVRYLDEA